MKFIKYIVLLVFNLSIISIGLTAQSLLINEIQYTNTETIKDSDGDSPDWIEIINAGENPINLSGYMLTDDTTETDLWTFPDYVLQPDSVKLIFASGKNKVLDSEWHSNFKIQVMEEAVYLLQPDGSVADKFMPACVPPDKSTGRYPNAKSEFHILTPTPATSNASGTKINIHYQADSLAVNTNSGLYSEDLTIKLTNNNAQNKIFYSLNGDEPDYNSTEYAGEIILNDINGTKNRFANKVKSGYKPGNLLTKANILRARVFSEGCPASNEISNTYFIKESGSFGYTVPIVSVITEKDNLFSDETGIYVLGNHNNCFQHGKNWERPIGLEIFEANGDLIIDQNAGIRIHGRGSRGAQQKSFRLYAREEYGKETFNHPFFEVKPTLENFKTLHLRSTKGWSSVLFKDELCHWLMQDTHVDYTAAETCVLFINGEYWGIYSLRERHDEQYVANNYNLESAEIDVIGYDKSGLKVEMGTREAYDNLLQNLSMLAPKSDEFYDYIKNAFDLDNVMDFYAAQIFLANADFPDNNNELWRLKSDTAKWRFFYFDFDGTMIRTNYDHLSEYNNVIDELQRFPEYSTFIFRSMLQNSRFKNEFNARFMSHLHSTFSADRIINKINEYENLYKSLVSEQIYRWDTPSNYNKWLNTVDMLKLFAMQRPTVMTEQLIDNFGNPFKVYPNPAKDNININLFSNYDNVDVKLLSSNGLLVFQNNYSGNSTISFQPNLKPGLYIMQIEMERTIYNKKIVIQ